MLNRTCVTSPIARSVVFERVARVRLERRARHQLLPVPAARQVRARRVVRGARLEAARPGRVALEVPRVHLHPPNRARGAETDDRPVVPGPAAPPGFPSVAHVRRIARHDQVVARPEEHVAAGDDQAAVLGGGEIDLAAPPQARPVGDDLAVDAQPRDAAVGKDPQAQVRRRSARRRSANEIVRVAGRAASAAAPRAIGARVRSSGVGSPAASQTSIAHAAG